MNIIWDNLDLWSIPLLAGFIGWFTNWLAIYMTFYPVEFVGLEFGGVKARGLDVEPLLGWQGIIPAKAEKMAARAVDLITSKLIDIKEQFSKIDPKIVAEEMGPKMEELTKNIIEEAMQKNLTLAWSLFPKQRKEAIYKQAALEFPQATEDIMRDIKENITELLDLKAMVIENLTRDKSLLNHIFLEVGKKEFKFIEYSGFVFGAYFGVIQMIFWWFVRDYDFAWITLPVGGVIVGYLTNWLALKMIFEPEEPRSWMGLKVQGLFIKRQKEVSEAYSKIVAEKVITVPQIFDKLLEEASTEKLLPIVRKHISESIDKTAGIASSLIMFTAGTKTYEQIKQYTAERFIEELPNHIKSIFNYAEEALSVRETLYSRMSNLPPKEFVNFLRPVFQEDEWKLILIGAILGGVAGVFQIFIT
jgi:uncharacterized membrane protein YheB (UPF0754 family)